MHTHSQLDHLSRLNSFIILFIAIAADQLSKYLATILLGQSKELSFFRDLVSFKIVHNPYGFIGVFSNSNDFYRIFSLYFFVGAILILCLYLLFSIPRDIETNLYYKWLALTTGAGMSNLFDRLIHDGSVIDFMSFGSFGLRTGVFNLADFFIILGSFVVGYKVFSSISNTPRK